MPGQLKVDEIVDTAGTGPVSAINGLKTDSLTNIAGTAGYPLMRLETAKAATGTSVEFTGIPSWAKRLTVLFNGISTDADSPPMVQLGNTTFTTSGYSGACATVAGGVGSSNFTTGFQVSPTPNWTNVWTFHGALTIVSVGSNAWSCTGSLGAVGGAQIYHTAGTLQLSGVLDRLRIIALNGTAAFDAGNFNVLIEGY